MQDKYQIEIDEFREKFNCLKDKRFVLYGIGRYTATLVQGLKDFNFVGLMDKDPQNIGKEMFGLPILSVKQTEENGDLVVINTSETYWNVIYSRIEHIKIPVYYKNGERAQKKDFEGTVNPYSNLSLDGLLKEIDNKMFKVSMRSKNIDVAEVTSVFNGGGHKFAAGCVLKGSAEDCVKKLLTEIKKQGL